MHQPDHAGRAAHVALHVLHAGGALDGNAAGIEADALADERHRLIATLGAVPAHDHGAARPRRTLADTEQRAHAELGHGLDVEHLDLDAELLELAGAAGELLRIEYVRRLVDEFAGDDDTIDDIGFRRKGLARRADVFDPKRNLRAHGGILAVLLPSLVAVEFVGPQPQSRSE